MIRLFGSERSFSNHIERKKSKCDYHFTRNLTSFEKENLENMVNEIIEKDLLITSGLLPYNKAKNQFTLNRQTH